jgi:hypothetical protein
MLRRITCCAAEFFTDPVRFGDVKETGEERISALLKQLASGLSEL